MPNTIMASIGTKSSYCFPDYLSEDRKLDNKKKDLEAKRLVRSTMTEKEQENSKQKERERKTQLRRMKSKEELEYIRIVDRQPKRMAKGNASNTENKEAGTTNQVK